MSKRPRVSIIVRSIGRPTLRHALASLRQQTYPNLEIVVINAKGPGHPAVTDDLGRHTLHFVDSDERLTAATAANRGLASATGEYIGFLDDDDTYEPEHVATLMDHATGGGHEVVYSGVRMIDQYHRVTRERLIPFNPLILFHYCFIAFTTVLFHRRFVEQGCRFDESLEICEDWDFWLQLSRHTRFEMVPAITVNYFMAAGSSGTGAGANQRPDRVARYTKIVQMRWDQARRSMWEPVMQRLAHAISMHQAGERESAAAAYRSILIEYPDEPNTLHALGRYELDCGNPRAARTLVLKAISLNGDAGEYHLTLGMINEQLGDQLEAARCYRQALVYAPALAPVINVRLFALRVPGPGSNTLPRVVPNGASAVGVGRNSPCPCGSGKRYKECCGRAAGAGQPAASASPNAEGPTAAQRAAGKHIEAVSALMQSGEVAAAKRRCEQVLATEPEAAEILRVLGMIALEYDRLDEADGYFQRVAAKDPDWPGLHENVREWRARKALAEDNEEACKRLREGLGTESAAANTSRDDPDKLGPPPKNGRPQIHLLTMYCSNWGGGELQTRQLASVLAPYADVTIWSPSFPGAVESRDADGVSFRLLDAKQDHHPQGGTLVFIGADQPDHEWIHRARADRVIVLHTTHDPLLLRRLLDQIAGSLPAPAEIVYCSKLLANLTGLPGRIEYSAIAVDPLVSVRRNCASTALVLGKLCRNAPRKHHPNDPALYRELIARGHRVRVMSGSFLELFFRAAPIGKSLRLLPIGAQDAAEFLASLDCFVYRTHPALIEGFGRAVAEAMAAGLPVVCGRLGGYAELIEHGVNGYLFDDEVDALAIIDRLAADPAERQRVGQAARESMLDLYGPSFQRSLIDYYLG